MPSEATQILSECDQTLSDAMYKVTSNGIIPRINWPTRDVKPISEYQDAKLFCLSFPWLYPGGVGDIKDCRKHKIDTAEWAENLLFYGDGRFAKDKQWCFFTLNYIQRHRNQSQSQWFVRDFIGQSPPSLEELQEKIESGDQTFVEKLMYFGKSVPGSAAYWRSKKSELYSWINHHIEKGRGAPNIFMTLSCAEYFWPDLKRILEDFILHAEGRKVNLELDHSTLNNVLNDYTLVVQEFFHLRVQEYFKTIGINVFGIKYYWGRFEFAKSRGQIHLHLLGITNNITAKDGIYTKLYKCKGNQKKQAKLLARWARSNFNMTAEVRNNTLHNSQKRSPCKKRFCQTKDLSTDQNELCHFCQIHKCSDYCMRDIEKKEKGEKKVCLYNII